MQSEIMGTVPINLCSKKDWTF